MYLVRLDLTDYRCYQRATFTFDRLGVLIGENDAGKTHALDAIAVLFGRAINEADFRRLDAERVTPEVIIEGELIVEDHDSLPAAYRSGDLRDRLVIRRRFTGLGPVITVLGRGLSDSRLNQAMPATQEKEILKGYGVTPGTNAPKRREQLEQLVQDGVLWYEDTELTITAAAVEPHLPLVVRASASDYSDPARVVQQALRGAARAVIAPVDPETGVAAELPALAETRLLIQRAMDDEILEALTVVQRHHAKILDIKVLPTIDFSRSLSVRGLQIDTGQGLSDVSTYGDGTKKRLWMALLEWERAATRVAFEGSIVRLYDEPDASLHYEAQKRFLKTILDDVRDPAARTQVILATHSVSMIEGVPVQDITAIRATDEGSRFLTKVSGDGDQDLLTFYNEVAASVGLSNLRLLYERAFLLVEGESEESAIPKIYSKVYGTSLIEDGIVLVNVSGCSNWRSVVRVLLKYRLGNLHLLLDSDCKLPTSSAHLRAPALKELGCGPTFVDDQVTFIGTVEYEDSFGDSVIVRALDKSFPRADGRAWSESDIANLRVADKFSEALMYLVKDFCKGPRKPDAKKPVIASVIADAVDVSEVPEALLDAFERARLRTKSL